MDYFILDPDCLLSYKNDNNLPEDLLTEFTTKETGDKVVEDGIIVPISGVKIKVFSKFEIRIVCHIL